MHIPACGGPSRVPWSAGLLVLAVLLIQTSDSPAADGAWVGFTAAGIPNSSRALAAVDADRHQMYLYGPLLQNTDGDETNETYAIDFAATPPRIRRHATVGLAPARRADAALVFDRFAAGCCSSV